MVNNKKRGTVRDRNDMQDVGVQGVRAKGAGSRKNENGIRHLRSKGLLAHYAHLSELGTAKKRGCRICSQGLSGSYHYTKAPVPVPVVDENSRVDKEEDDTPPLSNGWPSRER